MTDPFTSARSPDDAPGDGPVQCPHCGSTRTTVEGRKGTSICRVLYFCQDCEQPFEELR